MDSSTCCTALTATAGKVIDAKQCLVVEHRRLCSVRVRCVVDGWLLRDAYRTGTSLSPVTPVFTNSGAPVYRPWYERIQKIWRAVDPRGSVVDNQHSKVQKLSHRWAAQLTTLKLTTFKVLYQNARFSVFICRAFTKSIEGHIVAEVYSKRRLLHWKWT